MTDKDKDNAPSPAAQETPKIPLIVTPASHIFEIKIQGLEHTNIFGDLDRDNSRIAVYGSRLALILRRLPQMLKATRPMAYSSEVGESFRPVTNKNLVRFLYGLSWTYVIVDTAVYTYGVRDRGNEIMMYSCLDKAVWHSLASMLLPAFFIHTIVKFSGKAFKKVLGQKSKLGVWIPVLLGLSSIPFIIHPLDDFTDFAMDFTLREYAYKDKVPKSDHKKCWEH